MQQSFIHQLIEQLPKEANYFRNTTVIFPTKRACKYFEKVLAEQFGGDLWLPQVVSIQEFLYEHVPYVVLQESELVAMLHPIHERITDLKQSFVDFYKWGQMMLKDFSEIDQYLIDSEYLFHYIKSYKVIDDEDTLSQEQKILLNQFWESLPEDKSSSIKEQFLKTWQFLSEIYDAFQAALVKQNAAYEGMAYRALLNSVESSSKSFKSRNFVLAGFNALTAFEERLFVHLCHHYETKIFWDADEHYLHDEQLEAGFFIRRYLQLFPERANVLVTTNLKEQHKNVELANCPLETVQIDYALQQALAQPSTVLVLADESLLYPLIKNLPTDVGYNITMGYPLMMHSIHALLKNLLEFRRYFSIKKSISAKLLLKVLKHPLLQSHFESSALVKAESIAQVFGFFGKPQLKDLFGDNVLLEELLSKTSDDADVCLRLLFTLKADFDNASLEGIAIDACIELFQQLKSIALKNGINLAEEDVYKLLKTMMAGVKIPFESTSEATLQIMGFLETRNLDFENVIVIGATDDHLPGTNKSNSFIPFTIRKALNLPTYQENDAIFAYHFYRLMQRAENIRLVAANPIDKNSNRSRFMEQISYEWERLDNIMVSEQDIGIGLPQEITKPLLQIDKRNDFVLLKLEQYFKSEKQLSASALNTYINCPFQFYLKYIVGIHEPEDISEIYDNRVIGQIFHKMMECFYEPFLESKQWIDAESLGKFYKSADKKRLMQLAFESEQIKYSENSLVGQHALAKEVLLELLDQMIKKDIELTKQARFRIVGLEKKLESIPMQLDNGKTVYFKCYIDRVDEVEDAVQNYLRIIDYKTGKVNINSNYKKEADDYIAGYFENNKFKEGFQGYFYAWILRQAKEQLPIQVGFYGARKISGGLIYLQKGERLSDSLLEFYDERLHMLVETIFNLDIPFSQADVEEAYKFGKFRMLVE